MYSRTDTERSETPLWLYDDASVSLADDTVEGHLTTSSAQARSRPGGVLHDQLDATPPRLVLSPPPGRTGSSLDHYLAGVFGQARAGTRAGLTCRSPTSGARHRRNVISLGSPDRGGSWQGPRGRPPSASPSLACRSLPPAARGAPRCPRGSWRSLSTRVAPSD